MRHPDRPASRGFDEVAGSRRHSSCNKVEPEFSEEARKAKYQGVVVLSIEVDANGNVRNVRVQRGLGLGLDEKAIDAVSRWRFRPGLFDGKASGHRSDGTSHVSIALRR